MTTPTEDSSLPEQLQVRRDKRARLLAAGNDPYPISVDRTHSAAQVHAQWGHLVAGDETDEVVGVSGRVVFIRNTGKLCFATLQDGFTRDDSGTRLQVMISLAEVGEQRLADWKADVDLGDFVSVTGRVIASKRGELILSSRRTNSPRAFTRPMAARRSAHVLISGWSSPNASEMYLRNINPSTTCLYSAASIFLRNLSAAFQSCFSNGSSLFALVLAMIHCFPHCLA